MRDNMCQACAWVGGLGGGLAFLGLAFFLLNILSFHSAMPRNAVFPEGGHNFRAKRSLAFLGRSLSLSGSAFCAGKNGIRQKHDYANSFLGRSLVGFADLNQGTTEGVRSTGGVFAEVRANPAEPKRRPRSSRKPLGGRYWFINICRATNMY